MEIAAILAMVMKGVSVATTLIQAGKDATPVLLDLVGTFGKDGEKKPSREEVEAFEARLDAKIDEFNAPLPPKDAT